MASQRIVFNHVGLCVADTARSRRFYEELLGFTFWWELEPPDEGTDQLLQLKVGLTHVSLSVSDLAAVVTSVEGFGGSVVQGSVSAQSAMIRDPDGQLIELLADLWLAALPPPPRL